MGETVLYARIGLPRITGYIVVKSFARVITYVDVTEFHPCLRSCFKANQSFQGKMASIVPHGRVFCIVNVFEE